MCVCTLPRLPIDLITFGQQLQRAQERPWVRKDWLRSYEHAHFVGPCEHTVQLPEASIWKHEQVRPPCKHNPCPVLRVVSQGPPPRADGAGEGQVLGAALRHAKLEQVVGQAIHAPWSSNFGSEMSRVVNEALRQVAPVASSFVIQIDNGGTGGWRNHVNLPGESAGAGIGQRTVTHALIATAPTPTVATPANPNTYARVSQRERQSDT